MKNILKIIRTDYHNIKMNVVAIVVIMGMCLLPSLYAWFNISSNWDPYGESSTKNLQVAVFSGDEGYTLGSLTINIGESIVETLKTESTIGWQFEDSEEDAVSGVNSGKYYAAVIIPEDFTSGIAGIIDGDLDGAKIVFYENEKKNAIAAKITSKAQSALKTQINSEVFGTFAEVSFNAAQLLKDMEEDEDYSGKAQSKLSQIRDNLQSDIDTLNSLQQASDSTAATLQSAADLCGKITDDAREDFSETTSGTISLSGLEKAVVRIEDYAGVLQDGNGSVSETISLLEQLQSDIDTASADISNLKNDPAAEKILNMLENSPEEFATYLSSLVDVDTVPVYETDTNGSAMSSFYTTLAIWVGALILVAIIKTKVKPNPQIENVKTYQKFFGRYMIFFVLGQIQTLVCVLGDVLYLGVQCLHPFRFWLAGAVMSFVFTMMIYALTFALGNVGEAIAVIIMVVQIAGAGGTFAIELLPSVFRGIYVFMPFNYAMNAMRECVSGMYGNDYWIYLGKLLLFAAAAIAFGLLAYKPFGKITAVMEASKEKTDLMA